MKKLLLFQFLLLSILIIRCADYSTDSDTPDPVTLRIIAVSDSSVTLRWTASTAEDFQDYRVYYGTNNVVDTTDKVSDTIHFQTDTVKTVTKLDPQKRYYFRVIVTTISGAVSGSNIVDTITLRDLQTLAIDLDQPDSTMIGETSVDLSWSINWPNSEWPYVIFMDTTAKVDSTDSLIQIVNDGEAVTIEGLSPLKKYWFRIYAVVNEDTIGGSNIISVTLQSSIPQRVSSRVVAGQVTDSSIGITWSSSTHSDFKRYVIVADTQEIADSISDVDTIDLAAITHKDPNDTTVRYTGLSNSMLYYFGVFVEDSLGHFSLAGTCSTSTLASPSYSVTLRTDTTTFSDSSVTLVWSKTTLPSFYRYEIYYGTDSIIDTSAVPADTVLNISTTSHKITGLGSFTKYFFLVVVRDTAGKGEVSNRISNFDVVIRQTLNADSLIWIYWDPYDESDFNAYKVYRSKTYPVTRDSMHVFSTLNAGNSDFVDSTAVSQTEYYYRMWVFVTGRPALGSNTIRVTAP